MVSVLVHSPSFFCLLLKRLYPHVTLYSTPLRTLTPFPVASIRAVRTQRLGADAGDDPAVLRRPVISPVVADEEAEEESSVSEGEVELRAEKEEWVDWEDQILQETVPLVGFARMILHSGKYEIGDKLISDHEKTIVEKLLLYHPESEKKIGCGIEYIKVGLHPDFHESRCLFIVRSDGQAVDFSFWKCIKGLIRKKYPLYADSFILRHFRRRRPHE